SALLRSAVILDVLDRRCVIMGEGLRGGLQRGRFGLQLLREFNQLGFSFLVTGAAGEAPGMIGHGAQTGWGLNGRARKVAGAARHEAFTQDPLGLQTKDGGGDFGRRPFNSPRSVALSAEAMR